MKRIKLSDRNLPSYSRREELLNMITHIVGGSFGILVLVLCVLQAVRSGSIPAIIGSVIYGMAMISLYTVSSVYHGLRPGTAKKVMQVIDHCTIYFLIVGTYTPILLTAFLPIFPVVAWCLLAAEWILCAIAVTLTAIDLKKYTVFSMICYIGMGWGIIFFLPQCVKAMTPVGFYWLLSGGIAYTIGAVFYGIGSKKPWIHSVFHIFVVIGSLLHFVAIYFFAF